MSSTDSKTETENVVVRLPEPPAGHYWSVYQGAFHMDHLALRKTGRFWDKTVVDRVLPFRDKQGPLNPEDVLWNSAASIMAEHNASSEWEKYYGDYTPVK